MCYSILNFYFFFFPSPPLCPPPIFIVSAEISNRHDASGWVALLCFYHPGATDLTDWSSLWKAGSQAGPIERPYELGGDKARQGCLHSKPLFCLHSKPVFNVQSWLFRSQGSWVQKSSLATRATLLTAWVLPGNPLAGSLYHLVSLYRVLNFGLSVNEELVVPPGLPDFYHLFGQVCSEFCPWTGKNQA